jgi:hypothetical protein
MKYKYLTSQKGTLSIGLFNFIEFNNRMILLEQESQRLSL